MQRTAVCGRPITPKHTRIQNEAINGRLRICSPPWGDTSAGSIWWSLSTALCRPPAAWITATNNSTVPINITRPCMASFSTLARKPPKAVYSAMLTPKISRPVS
ncbi:hypothetical protein D3C78_1377380 [compost metagenome]